ncbi:DUF3025 domain-containing protein [Chitinibacter sp. FCG-7]|uniref:DUF3025 domain-containing protein n=1 Tax=Chitinibacter mangrovi TaxID=3153927 RepID=A0AAU7FBG7_9NEIS
MSDWPSELFENHPAFQPIRAHLSRFSAPPNYQDWAATPVVAHSASGAPIRFVPSEQISEYYELAIYQHGQVATRLNWHDTFNAMIWHAFPLSKSALNAMHHRIIAADPAAKARGPARDAATLFDECGFILPYCDEQLLDYLIAHEWTELFVDHAAAWGQRISAFSFGHANFEHLLAPFIGLTGKCWPVKVQADFFQRDTASQCQELDQILARLINDHCLQKPRQLPALPYLGIPGWHPQQNASFYENRQYFRKKRIRSPNDH